jgi:hypothetical protein
MWLIVLFLIDNIWNLSGIEVGRLKVINKFRIIYPSNDGIRVIGPASTGSARVA